MDERSTLDESPPTAADALAIIEREQARTGATMTPNLPVMYGTWGLAWLLIGLGAWAAATGRLGLPGWALGTALAVIVLVACAVSVAVALRSGRGVRPASGAQGVMYGFSWAIGMTSVGLLMWGLERVGLPGELAAVLYPAAYVLVAGVLYLVGGAVWNNRTEFVLGAWTVAVAVASVHAGSPGNYLVMGLAGGGGLLVTAAHHHVRRIR